MQKTRLNLSCPQNFTGSKICFKYGKIGQASESDSWPCSSFLWFSKYLVSISSCFVWFVNRSWDFFTYSTFLNRNDLVTRTASLTGSYFKESICFLHEMSNFRLLLEVSILHTLDCLCSSTNPNWTLYWWENPSSSSACHWICHNWIWILPFGFDYDNFLWIAPGN